MLAKERGGAGGGGAGDLIPGLPEELVLGNVLTRLPWYVRPVCRAVSKSWRACIDTSTKRPDLRLKSRKHLLPLLRGCAVVCVFDAQIFISKACMPQEGAGYYTVPCRNKTYQIHRQWHKLPPLQGLLPPPPACLTVIASSGMVYVWSNEEQENFVLKMDMGSGDWTWNKLPVPHRFNGNAVPFNGKIYVPNVSVGESANPEEKGMVLVYDMMTDKCEPVKAWNRDYFGICRKKESPCAPSPRIEEELYSFIEHYDATKLEILMYDACRDAWRSEEMIPIPECQWSEIRDIKLVTGDCFEPAPEAGINTIWIDTEGEVISWFNSSLHETWVEFDYHAVLEGKCLEYLQFIGGSMYGIFIEVKDDQDDEEEEKNKHGDEEERTGGQDPELVKRTLMKGTMSVSGNIVNWEEVLDVGCFLDAYYLNPSVVSPIDHYTLMD